MPSAATIQPERNTSFLFKSPPGFGKTIAAASAAIFGKVWIAYFDKRNPVELLTFYKKHRPELLQRIDYEVYGSHNAGEYLDQLIKFRKNGCTYDAIVSDSVTSISSAAVNWSLAFRDPKGSQKDDVNPKDPKLLPSWDEYKVETSLVTQALDICKMLNVMNIWTAHPLHQLKVQGSGRNITAVTQTQTLVSYGNKVGELVPGQFNEIYHFARMGNQRKAYTDLSGDDFAKTSLNLPIEIDFTDKLFFEVWKDLVNKAYSEPEVKNEVDDPDWPFQKTEVSNQTKWKV